MSTNIDEPRTFSVTLELPAAILTRFHETQRAREDAHMGWQTLEGYLTMRLLDYELQEHVKRQRLSTGSDQDGTTR